MTRTGRRRASVALAILASARRRGSPVALATLVSVFAVAALGVLSPPSLAAAQASTDGAADATAGTISSVAAADAHEAALASRAAVGEPAPRGERASARSDSSDVAAPSDSSGSTDSPDAATTDGALEHLGPPRDVTWDEAPTERECERRDGMRYASCDGPRRVVVPTGEARERAERLGLGTHATADALWTGSPRAEWVAEAGERHEGLLWPVAAGLFSRGFGAARVHDHVEGTHRGLDVVAAEGAHLRAVDDALVAYADNGVRGLGNVLFLVLGDGSTVIYAHCQALLVAAGERVRRGDVVGLLGHTGLTVRAHLHLEWRRDGEPRDPMPQMRERPSFRVRVEEAGEVTWLSVPANRLEASVLPPAADAETRDASVSPPPAEPLVASSGAAGSIPDETTETAKADVSPPTPPAFILACTLPGDDDGEAEEEARH